jgi:hypothetical protein
MQRLALLLELLDASRVVPVVGDVAHQPIAKEPWHRLAGKHGKAKALSILAAKLGRAVYFMLSKERSFDSERFLAHGR